MSTQNSLVNLSAQAIFQSLNEELRDEFIKIVKDHLVNQVINSGCRIDFNFTKPFKSTLIQKDPIKIKRYLLDPDNYKASDYGVYYINEDVSEESIKNILDILENDKNFPSCFVIYPNLMIRIIKRKDRYEVIKKYEYTFKTVSHLFRFLEISNRMFKSLRFIFYGDWYNEYWNGTEEQIKEYMDKYSDWKYSR